MLCCYPQILADVSQLWIEEAKGWLRRFVCKSHLGFHSQERSSAEDGSSDEEVNPRKDVLITSQSKYLQQEMSGSEQAEKVRRHLIIMIWGNFW